MGIVQSTISSMSFDFMDDGSEAYKHRLPLAYKQYKEEIINKGLKIDVFSEFRKKFDDDDEVLGNFLFKNKLALPASEELLLAPDGFFNKLTEQQAMELSVYLKDFLPKFREGDVAKA